MKNLEDRFFEHEQVNPTVHDERITTLVRHSDIFSSVAAKSLYVLDIPQEQFCYVKSDGLFLCGFSAEEALREGYDFYSKIVYPEDLSLWTDMRKAVLRYLKDFEGEQGEIDYFYCTFRLQRKHSLLIRPFPQMVYQLMIPVWEDHKLCYLICTVGSSTAKEVGNLCLYDKDGSILGNIYTDNIYEIVSKEIEEGKSWFRIRSHAPCNDCVYQWLCPPPSNYEIAIGRPNLCFINESKFEKIET
jgi:hypothetical protein